MTVVNCQNSLLVRSWVASSHYVKTQYHTQHPKYKKFIPVHHEETVYSTNSSSDPKITFHVVTNTTSGLAQPNMALDV